jgi:cyclopropane-fatty-acyl-phospholipid synthase
MKATSTIDPRDARRDACPGKMSRLQSAARRVLFAQLASLEGCRLTIVDGDEWFTFGAGDAALAATVTVHDRAFYIDVISGGSVGGGEAYTRGAWSADDLVAVVRIFVRNMALLDRMEGGLALVSAVVRRAFHLLHRNSRSGSRRNIRAHYDLGNDLFALFLDRNLMYSSAVFEEPGMTLEQASDAKLERICRKLGLRADDHVLEIGTGWGGFALYAAGHYGCRVTTTTISREQHRHAAERIRAAGLGDRIELLLDDFRDLDGQYDKLVSIEMIEAIGHRNLPVFFERAGRLLKPDGMMLLQAITIADQRYRRALKEVDFIQRHIFPGGFLPSVTAMLEAVTAASDMRLFHLEDIGPHYARTVAAWRERFLARASKVRGLGYPEEFIRMWEFYLGYCEGGFIERVIGNAQMLLVKPLCRREPIVPSLAAS